MFFMSFDTNIAIMKNLLRHYYISQYSDYFFDYNYSEPNSIASQDYYYDLLACHLLSLLDLTSFNNYGWKFTTTLNHFLFISVSMSLQLHFLLQTEDLNHIV